jgi:hypothetical protein
MFQDLPPQTTTATTTGIELKGSADALLDGNNPPSFAEREEAILSPEATDRVTVT